MKAKYAQRYLKKISFLAKFRGRLRQVQEVKMVNKVDGGRKGVFVECAHSNSNFEEKNHMLIGFAAKEKKLQFHRSKFPPIYGQPPHHHHQHNDFQHLAAVLGGQGKNLPYVYFEIKSLLPTICLSWQQQRAVLRLKKSMKSQCKGSLWHANFPISV